MKTTLILLLLLTLAFAAFQAPAPPRPLAGLVPTGPLLYLESQDFSALLQQWNQSPEKATWLKSDNYEVFSRSRLFLRLQDAQREFASAAGVPPDMDLLQQVAGGDSALAVYDIGKLQFLYITRLPLARTMQTSLWQVRGKYEPRNAAGIAYYVQTDPTTGRVAAFAATDDYLLLATREDLLAAALSLVAGQQGRKLADDAWFDRSVRAASAPGDLRLVLDLQKITASPYFRSYWIQRNASDLKDYSAAISDLHLSSAEYKENRVLLRSDSAPAAATGTVADVLRLVPDGSGLYRAWANPSADNATALLMGLLSPRSAAAPASQFAPPPVAEAGVVGNESDLETRIDQPPLVQAQVGAQPVHDLLDAAHLTAMLQIKSSRALPDAVFVGHDTALVLVSSSDWNAESVRDLLQRQLDSPLTTSQLGLKWVEAGQGSQSYFRFDGLAPLVVAVRGKYLVVANAAPPLQAALANLAKPVPSESATYAAGFQHSREAKPFVRMTALIDRPGNQSSVPGEVPTGNRPQFFSKNIASLSRTLSAVASETILSRDTGPQVQQTVTYRWAQ